MVAVSDFSGLAISAWALARAAAILLMVWLACCMNVSTWVGVLRTGQEFRLDRQNKAGGDELVFEVICQAR